MSLVGHKRVLPMAPAFVLLLVAGIAADSQIPKEPVKWSLKASLPDKPLKSGDSFSLQLEARIEPGWHLYSTQQEEGGPVPTRIALASDQPFEQNGALESSEPNTALDPNFNLMTEYYEGEAFFAIPVKVAGNAPPGKTEARVTVSFQTCNEELCLPPKTLRLSVPVIVAAGR